MRRRLSNALLGLLVLAGLCVLSGCGGASHPVSSTRPVPAAGATGGFGAEPAAQVLTAAVSAMRAARAYRAQGTVAQGGSDADAVIAVHVPASVDAAFVEGSESVRAVIDPSGSYIFANEPFWKKQAPSLSADVLGELADRWFKVSRTVARSLTGVLAQVAPSRLAACLAVGFAKATTVGTQTVDGQSAVILHSTGVPGTSPGNLYIAVAAPHYPLRFEQTGKLIAGSQPACENSPAAGSGSGLLNFSDFNDVAVASPRSATTLP